MVNQLRKLFVITVIILCLFIVGCSNSKNNNSDNQPESSTDETLSEQNKFNEFSQNIFVSDVQNNTINLHYTLSKPEDYGITDYPITLGDFSKEYFTENKKSLENTLTQLGKFDYEQLTFDQQITYDILKDYITTELSSSHLYLYNEPLSSTLGDQAQLPILFAEYSFNNKMDVDNYLLLISKVKPYFSSLLAFENEKITAGLFMSDVLIDAVVSQCNKFIDNPEQNYLIEVFNEKIDLLSSISQEEKNLYKEQNKSFVINDLIPAYKYLIEELTKLKGSGKNSGGLYYLENGKEYYEYLVLSNTGSSKSITDLTSIIKSKIQNDLKDMNTLIINNPDLIEAVDNYAFDNNDPNKIISTLIEKMNNDFPEPPKVKYSFKYVHKSLEEDLSPAFYLIPPIDDYKNNVIYINQNEKYSTQDLFSTIAHEGYPGHLYQTTYFDSTNPDPIRSLLSYSGYIEGWATYTEIHSYQYTNLDANIAELLSLNTSYALGIYSRIDIGVNYEGWTQGNVLEYLSDYGIDDVNIANEIFMCMVENPGNYLNYYVGYLEILELREIAEKSLGDDFVLKDFHQFMLDMGPAPFNVILKHLNTWISKN